MTPSDLHPRHDHVGRELSIPHEGLYRATRLFLEDLQSAEDSYRQEVLAIREKLGVPAVYRETDHVQRFSMAVQVFAAMTMEAVISFYAVLRFGGEKHDEHFRWDPALKRLQKALKHAGVQLDDEAEILELVRSVMEGRHRIVHAFTVEYSGSEQATIQQPDRQGPDETAAAARRAMEGLDRFLALLREVDPVHAHYFVPS
jgi:hypothetical protein